MTLIRRGLIGLAMLAVAAVLVAAGWRWARPVPSLAKAAALAEAHRFKEAEALVAAILRNDPTRSDAHMLAAQLALEHPEMPGQNPSPVLAFEALEHLKHVHADEPHLAALAALNRGKAEYRLSRLDDAEVSWLEALRLEPTIPEAGLVLARNILPPGPVRRRPTPRHAAPRG